MKRIWKAAFLTSIVVGALFTATWGASMLWFVRTADVLDGRSRADLTVGYGMARVEYYKQAISWIAYEKGLKWRPRAPRLWPKWQFNSWPRYVVVPLWMPAITFFGVAAFIRWRCRYVPGHCQACGYDLRTVTLDRCPECGARPSKRALAGQTT